MHKLAHCLIAGVAAALPLSLSAVATAHEGHDHAAMAHGDHEPHHSGFVAMYQDLHFEVVMPEGGGIQLYFTDEARADLPAATVSDVAVEVERAGSKPEFVKMAIGANGDLWEGKVKALADARAVIRVAFLYKGAPAQFNISAANLPTQAKGVTAKDAAKPAHHG
jgi:hypothetical protein